MRKHSGIWDKIFGIYVQIILFVMKFKKNICVVTKYSNVQAAANNEKIIESENYLGL